MNKSRKGRLERIAPTNIMLSLLWASLMSLYIYNDYFNMYLPGAIESMSSGRIGPFDEPTEMTFVFLSLMLAVPALMIYLSAALPAAASRWLNVLLGLAYTAIEVWSFSGALFYQIVVVMEIILTALIFWTALRWPRERPDQGNLHAK